MSKILPLHADTVGSYLRSQVLKEARLKFASGEISREQLIEIEDQEITKLVQALVRCRYSNYLFIEHFKKLNAIVGDRGIVRYTIPSPNQLMYPIQWDTGIYATREEIAKEVWGED